MNTVSIIFGLTLIIFFISIILNLSFRSKIITDAIITGGIGAVLAGSYFGIVKDTILNKPNEPLLTFVIIMIFYFWYVITKISSGYLVKNQQQNYSVKNTSFNIKDDENKVETKSNASISKTSGVFIGVLIVFMVIFLFIATRGSDNGGIVKYNILTAIMVILGVLFAFFSGNRLDYESKAEIVGFTFSYLIVFGVLLQLFIYNTFSFKNGITNTVIFFIWISLTYSISNFIKPKPIYINRT